MERDGIFSISQVNEYIKMLMDSNSVLGDIWVKGEISNFKPYSTGHLYFSLKDNESTIKAVMFRSSAVKLSFIPENGMKVIVHGRVSSYPQRGEYQIYVNTMDPDGKGALFVAFEQLKKKLEAEGLFDPSKKKQLPQFPRRVGVITSASGAAIHDILNISGRRYPLADIVIYPAYVQGELAPESLCSGIRYFNERSKVDAIIIGRGGGSAEDLWAFNDEKLARLIASSKVPVISAVGHETDFSICDFVSDVRAPTPSGAAELLFPDKNKIISRIEHMQSYSASIMTRKVVKAKNEKEAIVNRLKLCSPTLKISEGKSRLEKATIKLDNIVEHKITTNKRNFILLSTRLETSGPLATLRRGYAAVENSNGSIVTTVKDLSPGDKVQIIFKDGKAKAKIEEIVKEKN